MPKQTVRFTVALGLKETMGACRTAVAQLGWGVKDVRENHISCKESFDVTKSWPATLEIHLQQSGESTQITLQGSNFGIGPIPSNHLKNQVIGRFRNLVETSLATQGAAAPDKVSLSAELERLADLKAKGILTDEEFQLAKQKALNAEPGT